MVKPARESAPWFLWPVAALWDLLAFVLRLTGRLIGVLISLVLLVLGAVLTMTVVGAPPSRTTRPTIFASPTKRACHISWESTTTSGAPSASSLASSDEADSEPLA